MNAPQSKKTLENLLNWARSEFENANIYFGHGTDNPWDEAVFIASDCLAKENLTESDLSYELTESELNGFTDLCKRRINEKIPAAYLLGYMYFAGLKFKVTPDVLIPRSPLAELIQTDFEPWIKDTAKIKRALDLCCGSGCIGMAFAHYYRDAKVDVSDISEKALEIANHNNQALELTERVNCLQSDLFESLEGKYDLILSNPPYVSETSWKDLPKEYHHEPKLGLVSEKEGIEIVDRILKNAANYLNDEGILIVEVGESAMLIDESYPELPFIWLDFENGGDGVFILTKQDLVTAKFGDEYE